jgi:uncharacterized protein DUF3108
LTALKTFPRKLAAAVVALVLSIALICRPGAAQESRLLFSSGEKLRYAVRWRLVPAGEAELVLEREATAPRLWKVTAKASSVGYVSNIYKVDDEYQSTFRNEALCSNEIRKVINEGERHRVVSILFDQRRRLAFYNDREASGNAPPRQTQSSIPACVYDILSSLYYVRTKPLAVGRSIEIPLNDGSRTVPIRVDVQAREEVKTPIGTFPAIRVEPDLFSGNVFKGKGRIFVWFSDDASHLPLQLRAQIGIGTITATLSSIERQDGTP